MNAFEILGFGPLFPVFEAAEGTAEGFRFTAYYLFLIALIGFLCTYSVVIAYSKVLQGKIKGKMSDWSVILTAIFFGGPALLIGYILPEIRLEDVGHHRRFLVFGIVHTLWQIALVTLLIVLKVVPLS